MGDVRTTTLNDLAAAVDARCHSSDSPYVLILGRECARAAGQPLETVSKSIVEFATKYEPSWATMLGVATLDKSGGAMVDAVHALTAKLDKKQSDRLLRTFYAQVPVPLFYQDLASLMKAGYFRDIVTTNYDDLLEQALIGSGLVQGSDFVVLNVADPSADVESDAVRFSIIKLHGDLTRSNALLTESEIQRALARSRVRNVVGQEVKGDVVLFGYTGESPPLEALLQKSHGELWWIGDRPPDDSHARQFSAIRDLRIIAGDDGAAQNFFSRLYDRLIRRPAQRAMQQIPTIEGAEPLTFAAEVASAPPVDEGEDYLNGQLRRAKRQLAELRQMSGGETEPAVAAQIRYQAQVITKIEDQLRALPPNRKKLLDAFEMISTSVAATPDTDAAIKDFLRSQHDCVVLQFGRAEPNHALISAAVTAALAIGERLGPQVVEASVLRDLALFAPTLVSK